MSIEVRAYLISNKPGSETTVACHGFTIISRYPGTLKLTVEYGQQVKPPEPLPEMVCPRCGGKAFDEQSCGPDTYEDDITYTSEICVGCGLWHSGWTGKWLVDCTGWREEENCEEFIASEASNGKAKSD